MQLRLHANATTTPQTRAYIQQSTASRARVGARARHPSAHRSALEVRPDVADRSTRPRLRPGLRRARHRPPPHPTLPAADQRHGRALQPPPRRASCPVAAEPRCPSPPLSESCRTRCLHTFVAGYNRTRLRCLDYQAPAELLAKLAGHKTCAGKTVNCERMILLLGIGRSACGERPCCDNQKIDEVETTE